MSTSAAETERIPVGEKISYAVGDLASNLVYVAVGTYLTFFYTDIAGIPAKIVGTIFLVSRIFDGFYDLIVGVLMERFHSRFGKARPWILYLAIPYGVSAALLFTAPHFGPTGKIIYALVTYILTTVIIFTAINVPYGSLNALMTRNQNERGLLNTFRMIAAYIGAIIVASVTLPLVNAMGGGARAWTMTFAIYGAISIALFLTTFKFCKERVTIENEEHAKEIAAKNDQQTAEETTAPKESAGTKNLGRSIINLLHNKYWLILLLFGVVLYTTYNLMSVYPYYAKYILGNENFSSTMFTVRNFIELGGVFLAIPLIKKIGKRNICLLGCFSLIIGQLIIAINHMSYVFVMIGLGFAGIGVGAMFGVIFAMIADTIEYEEWRSGTRSEGIVYAGATFGQKIGGALGGAAVGWFLGFGGYIDGGNASAQPASALAQINFVFIWLPLILAIPMIILLSMYKLDKEYDSILHELRERNHSEKGNED